MKKKIGPNLNKWKDYRCKLMTENSDYVDSLDEGILDEIDKFTLSNWKELLKRNWSKFQKKGKNVEMLIEHLLREKSGEHDQEIWDKM